MAVLRRVFFWLAIVWCAIAAIAAVERTRFVLGAETVLGVVETVEGRNADCDGAKNKCARTKFTATVKYEAAGTGYRTTIAAGSSNRPIPLSSHLNADVQQGESIALLYDPTLPTRVAQDTLMGIWSMPLLALGLAALSFVLSWRKFWRDTAGHEAPAHEQTSVYEDAAYEPPTANTRPASEQRPVAGAMAVELAAPASSESNLDVASRYGTRSKFEESDVVEQSRAPVENIRPSSARERASAAASAIDDGPPGFVRLIGVALTIAAVVVTARMAIRIFGDGGGANSGAERLVMTVMGTIYLSLPGLVAFFAYRAIEVLGSALSSFIERHRASR